MTFSYRKYGGVYMRLPGYSLMIGGRLVLVVFDDSVHVPCHHKISNIVFLDSLKSPVVIFQCAVCELSYSYQQFKKAEC